MGADGGVFGADREGVVRIILTCNLNRVINVFCCCNVTSRLRITVVATLNKLLRAQPIKFQGCKQRRLLMYLYC